MELGRVLDAPAVRPVGAEEDGVGVDFLEDLEVAVGLDLEDRLRLRREARDALAGVERCESLAVLPVLELAAHECGLDRLGCTALLDDDGIEFEASVDIEDFFAVLEAEDPFPAAAVQEELPERAGTVIGVKSRRDDEAEATAGAEKRMAEFEEEFVEIDVGRSLMPKRVLRIGVAARTGAARSPFVVQRIVKPAAGDREALVALFRISPRRCRKLHEIRLRLEIRVVVEPFPFRGIVREVVGLFADRFLFSIGSIKRIDIREELLGVRLGDIPRRISKDRIESGPAGIEGIWKLDLPMEETLLRGDRARDRGCSLGRLMEIRRERRILERIRRPEPDGAPAVERLADRAERRASGILLAIDPRAFLVIRKRDLVRS